MAIITKHTVTNTSAKFQRWYKGTNKGIFNNVSGTTSYDADCMRQLAHSDYYSYNYYTTYVPLNNDSTYGSLSNINKTYKPTKITITCTRNGDKGTHSAIRTARFGIITAAQLNGTSGLTKYWDIAIQPAGSSHEYTLTSTASEAETFVNTIINGGYFTLGCNVKPTSNSSPMSVSNYLGINYSGFSINITWETRTTACGAPTSISFSSVVKPGGTLTISWSGATDGTNNTITGYDVYYRLGSAPTTTGYQERKLGVTGTSTTFTIPTTAARGTTFYAMVRTRGTAGSSYYSGFKSGSGGKVNTLPTTPTVTFNYSQIPSTGGTVQITNLSASDANGQSITYYYSTSLFGTKTPVKIKDSFQLTETTTYYFWSYDNLEYSANASSVTITRVSAPTVSLKVSGEGTSYKILDDDKDYYTSYKLTATPSAGTGRYRYYYKINNGDWVEFSTNEYFTSNTYTISDITKYCSPGDTIYFDVGYYQQIDYSTYNTSAWYATSGDVIPNMPSLKSIYNNNGSSTLPNTNENYFQDYIRVYFSKDTSIESATASAIMADSKIESTVSIFNTSFSGDSPYVVLSTSSLERGKLYEFRINLKRKSHTTTLKFERTKVFLPNFGEVMTISNSKIRPHLTSTDINILFEDETLGSDSSFYLSFPNIMGAPTNDLYQYGLSAENDSIKGLTLSVIHNNKTLDLENQKFIVNGDVLGTTISVQNLIDNFSTLGITTYNGQYSLTFSLSITTNFSSSITTESSFSPVLVLDFDIPFEKLEQTLEMHYYPADGTEWIKIEDNQLLRKGDKIKYSYTWNTYNSYDINYTAKIYRTSEMVESLNSDINWVDDIIGTFTFSNNEDIPELGKSKEKTIELERIISTITESKYLYFSITGVQNNSSVNLIYDEIKGTTEELKLEPVYAVSVQHTEAIAEISNGLYSKGTITLNFSCKDSGLKSLIESETYTVNLELEYSETQDFSNFNSLTIKGYLKTEAQPEAEPTFEEVIITLSNLEEIELIKYNKALNENEIWENGANFYYVRLKITTTDSNEGAQTQTVESYSNSIIIYNTTPTISYHTNYVGINYRLPIEEEDSELSTAVLVIGETSGRKQIYFMSSDGINALSGGTWDSIKSTEL